MATYLDGIVAWHRARAAADRRDLGELAAAAAAASEGDPVRQFGRALEAAAAGGRVAVIAEVKRRSPSKGDLALDLDPPLVAKDYEAGGAACLSVLTDGPHFGGSPEDLGAARQATSLPVLRKDFTVSFADIYDARLMGADAVLLIVAALADDELAAFGVAAASLGMTALVEVHDEDELGRGLDAGAAVIGVNQRDLRTFEVDRARAVRLGAAIPSDVLAVAESGIGSGDDVVALRSAGYSAVLVGETFVRSADRAAAVHQLVEAGSSPCG